MTNDPSVAAPKGRRFGRRFFSSSSKDDDSAAKGKAQPIILNGNNKVAERIKELERAKSPPPKNGSVVGRSVSNPGRDLGKDPSKSVAAPVVQAASVTTTITAQDVTPKLQKRQSKASSLFDLFSKPKVERARGHSEGSKLDSVPPPQILPEIQRHPAPAPMKLVRPDSQVYVNGRPVTGNLANGQPPNGSPMNGHLNNSPRPPSMMTTPGHSPNPQAQNYQFQPQNPQSQSSHPQHPQSQPFQPQQQQRFLPNQRPIPQRPAYQPASVRQQFQPLKQEDIWDPSPLFQAYPQAEKHGKLQGTNASPESLFRAQQIRRANQSQDPSASLDQPSTSSDVLPGRGRLKRLSVMTGSYADSQPDVVDKVFVLVTAGRLVQYAGSGSSDRMPEKILRLGAGSAAFVCDLIPGKHWVLQVVQHASDVGPSGMMMNESSEATAPFPSNPAIKPSRSFLSRLRMSPARGRNVNTMLLIFQSPDEMAGWLKAFRDLIERLGGRRRDTTDPEFKRDKEREMEEAVRKRLSQQPSHRFMVQREPGQFGETPGATLNRSKSVSPQIHGDSTFVNISPQKVSPVKERRISMMSGSSAGPVSPLMTSTPPILESEETGEDDNEKPIPTKTGGYFNGAAPHAITVNTNITTDVKVRRISSTPTLTTVSSSATNGSLSPDLLRLEPLKETSRFSSMTSIRTSRTSESETATITAATSLCSSPSSPPSPKKKELAPSPAQANMDAADSPRMPLNPGFSPKKNKPNEPTLQSPQGKAVPVVQNRQQTLTLAARRSKAPQPINLSSMNAPAIPAVPALPANAVATAAPVGKRLSIAVMHTDINVNQGGQHTPRFARATLVDVPKSPRSPRMAPKSPGLPPKSPRLPPSMTAIGEDNSMPTGSIVERISPKKRPMSTMIGSGMPTRGELGGAGNRRSYFRPVPIPVRPNVTGMPLPTRNSDGDPIKPQQGDEKPSPSATVELSKPSVLSNTTQFKPQLVESGNLIRQIVNPSKSQSLKENTISKEKENSSEMTAMDVAARLQQIDADITRRLSRIREQQAQDGQFGFDTLIGRQSAARATSRASVVPQTAAIPESPSMNVSMDLPSRPPSRTIHHSRESLVVTPSHMPMGPVHSVRRNSSLSSTTGASSFSRSSSPATITRMGAGSRLSTSSSLSLTQASTSSTSPSSTSTATTTQIPGKLRRPASVQVRADPAPFLSSRRSSIINQKSATPAVSSSRVSLSGSLNMSQKSMLNALQASLVAEAIAAEEKIAHGRTRSKDLTTLAALSSGSSPVVNDNNTSTTDSDVNANASETTTPAVNIMSNRSVSSPTPPTARASPTLGSVNNSAKHIVQAIASDLQAIRQHQHKISLSVSRSSTPTAADHRIKSSVSSIDLSVSSSRRSSVLLASTRPLSPPPAVSPPPAPHGVRGSRPSLSLTQSEITLPNLDATFAGPAPAMSPPAVPKRNPARPVMITRSASAASAMPSMSLKNNIMPTIATVAGPAQFPAVPGGLQTLPPRMPPPDCPLPRLPAAFVGQ